MDDQITAINWGVVYSREVREIEEKLSANKIGVPSNLMQIVAIACREAFGRSDEARINFLQAMTGVAIGSMNDFSPAQLMAIRWVVSTDEFKDWLAECRSNRMKALDEKKEARRKKNVKHQTE